MGYTWLGTTYGAITDAPINVIVPSGSLALNDARGVGVISLSGLTISEGATVTIQSGEELGLKTLDLGSAGPYGTLDIGSTTVILQQTGDQWDQQVQDWINGDGTGLVSSTGQIGYVDADGVIAISAS